jgi:hypothetical protein
MSLPIALKSILSTTFSPGLLMWVFSSRISRSAPNSHSAWQWFIRVLPNTPLAIGQTTSGAICWQPMSHFSLLIAVKCSMLVQWMKIWQAVSIIKLAGLCSLPLKFYITFCGATLNQIISGGNNMKHYMIFLLLSHVIGRDAYSGWWKLCKNPISLGVLERWRNTFIL